MNASLEDLKKYFYKNEEDFKICENNYYNDAGGNMAINLAFKDFSSRTLTKTTQSACVDVGKRKYALSNLAERFCSYFKDNVKNELEFAAWHKECCENFIKNYNAALTGYQEIGYGKAQKIVNMTFKYLYCYADAEKYIENGYFKYCHMPLDSFTLAWYRRTVKKEFEGSWSDMDKDKYEEIQKEIKDYLSEEHEFVFGKEKINLPKSSLESEFFVWQNERNNCSIKDILNAVFKLDMNIINDIDINLLSSIRIGRKKGTSEQYTNITEKLNSLKKKIYELIGT